MGLSEFDNIFIECFKNDNELIVNKLFEADLSPSKEAVQIIFKESFSKHYNKFIQELNSTNHRYLPSNYTNYMRIINNLEDPISYSKMVIMNAYQIQGQRFTPNYEKIDAKFMLPLLDSKLYEFYPDLADYCIVKIKKDYLEKGHNQTKNTKKIKV